LRAGVGEWLFGCDVCQEVCPWNAVAPKSTDPAWQPRAVWDRVSLAALADRDDDELAGALSGSAMERAKVQGLRRNIEIAVSNCGAGLQPGDPAKTSSAFSRFRVK
jgi:epoxyqueuosine reductase